MNAGETRRADGLKRAILLSGLIVGICLAALAVGLSWPAIQARYYVYKLCKASDYENHLDISRRLVKIGTPAVRPLIRALEDDDAPTREHAAMALGEIGDSRAVEPLLAVFNDSSRMVRARAAMALAKIKDPRAIEPLIRLFRNKESRDAACSALMFHDELAIAPLLRELENEDLSTRAFAFYTLEEVATDGKRGVVRSPFEFDASAPPDARRAQVAKIESYFREKRPEAFP